MLDRIQVGISGESFYSVGTDVDVVFSNNPDDVWLAQSNRQ